MRGRSFNHELLDRLLRDLKSEHGTTREEFATSVGLKRTTLAQYSTGRVKPPEGVVERLACALGQESQDFWISVTPATANAVANLQQRVQRLEGAVCMSPQPTVTGVLKSDPALVPQILDFPDHTEPALPHFEKEYEPEVLADYDGIQRVDVPPSWLRDDPSLFAVRVSGTHLEPDFLDGEILLVSPATKPTDANWLYFQPAGGSGAYVARYWSGAEGVTFTPVGRQRPGICAILFRDGADPPGTILGTVVATFRVLRRLKT